jgi:UDP-N-acetylmuramoylalanine--D-glutamate ligase
LVFRDAKVVVVGLGKSGLASVALLTAKGAEVVACDAKSLDQLPGAAATLARLNVPFERQSWETIQNADRIVISPGVPADLDLLERARRKGISVVGEVELAGYFLQGESIGITGSNCKWGATSARLSLPWWKGRDWGSGTCSSSQAFSWRPSSDSASASEWRSM